MKIFIKNLQKKRPVKNQQIIKHQVKKILKAQGLKNAFLSIVFVRDKKIRDLNKRFLNRNRSTDVLAFDLRDKSKTKFSSSLNGEIIISIDAAETNARYYKNSFQQEIKLYIIHGILHLLGYNDKKKYQIKVMRKKEKELLEIFK
jgi:probable rRNA maturation factor